MTWTNDTALCEWQVRDSLSIDADVSPKAKSHPAAMVLALHSLQPAPSKCNVLSSTHRASRVRAKVTAPGRRGGRSTGAAPSAVLDSLCSTVLQSSANTTAAVLATSFVLYTVRVPRCTVSYPGDADS